MQAGLVRKRLALSDIFTACGLTLRVFVAVVHVSVTVQPLNLTQPSCRRAARRRLGNRLPYQQRMVQAPEALRLLLPPSLLRGAVRRPTELQTTRS